MFTIEEIDPKHYRKKTRNATLMIMAIFIVIGMITATLTVKYLGPYNDNHIVLNFIGAFIGLVITFFIVKTFFINKPWMQEAMYAWRLKRSLMQIYNVQEKLKAKVNENDEEAIKIMRFYHLGVTQMNQLENNSYGQIDLMAEKKQHEEKMQALGIDLQQIHFEKSSLEPFKNQSQ